MPSSATLREDAISDLVHSAIDYDQRVISLTEILGTRLDDSHYKKLGKDLDQIRRSAFRNSDALKRILRMAQASNLELKP